MKPTWQQTKNMVIGSISKVFNVTPNQAKAMQINSGYGFEWGVHKGDLVFVADEQLESQIRGMRDLIAKQCKHVGMVCKIENGNYAFLVGGENK